MYGILNCIYATLLALATLGEMTETEMILLCHIAHGGKESRGGIIMVRIHRNLYHEYHQCE